jgi:nucleoside-diphosphate-sugar epimerase
LYEYRNLYNLDTRIVRIFNTYGPGMLAQDGRVISTFISQALTNQALTIFGNGNQTRSFCYVDDLIESIYRVSQLPKDVLTSPVNIGNDNEFTLIELVKIISRALGKELNVLYKSLPGDDPKQRRPDLTKARKLLNYEAKVSLEEGVQRTIDWFKTI